MKKLLLSMAAVLGITAMAWAGNGTQANPYTVSEVVAMGVNATEPGVYVKGYIVGSIPQNAASTVMQYATFTAENASNTNFILADTSYEDDPNYCIPVQLSTTVRGALSLQQNPDNLGHQVILNGDIEKYCGAIGLKNTASYEWVGTEPTPGGGGTGGNTGGNTGSGDAYLTNGLDPFTIENVTLPSDLSYVWAWDDSYGAKASAYYNSTRYVTDSYLISPEITLAADTKTATFSQALNFLDGNNRADFVNVVVREGNGAWQTVNVSTWPAGSDWGFVDNCEIDLSAYAGKTIQLAFRYTSTSSCAPTWEVKRVVIGGTAPGGNGGGSVDTPTGDNVTFDFTNPANIGLTAGADETEIDLTGKSYTNGLVSIAFDSASGASTPIRLFSSSGNWTFRFYNNTSFTISVPTDYHITGIEFNGTNLGIDWSYSNGSLSGTTWTPDGSVSSVTIGKTKTGSNPTIKTITVYYADGAGENPGGGGNDNPNPPAEAMSVTEALAWLAAGNSGNAVAQGYITSIKEVSTDYGNATYYIADDVNSSNTITVYRGYYLNGAKFTSTDQIKVGDFVVVEGSLEYYGNNKEPEFMTGNKIISINGGTGGGGNDNPGGGETPDTPTGENAMFDFTVPSSLGAGFSDAGEGGQEVSLNGVTLTKDVVSLSFVNNGTATDPRLYYGSGNSAGWTMRFYKDNVMTVSVQSGYLLTGIEFNGSNIGTDWSYSNGTLTGSTWTPSGSVTSVEIGKTATGNNPTIKSMNVYYTDEAGVDHVLVIDNADAVYYNLQGVRVDNPQGGIFVKVVNGKATKVLVK